MVDTDVVIVGGGPVGLTLAMWLADAGADVTVLERRSLGEPPPVKCNHISSRSMEILRRLGVASELRAAGLPDEHAHDAAFRTSMVAEDFGRIAIPGRAGRVRGDQGVDSWWPTPEPPHRVNQLYMEPILQRHAVERENVHFLGSVDVVDVGQSDDRAWAVVSRPDGASVEVHGRYLVGCDGGRSTVRRSLGIPMVGDAEIQRVQSTFVEVPSLAAMMASEPAWATIVLNTHRSGTAYAIDGEARWLIHNYLRADEADFESVDRHAALRTILGVDVRYDVISNEDWVGRRLIAERFRRDRILLCGDAAHIWVPYAGYGMNAGIADAANLAWLLAAVLAGWGDELLVDAYEAERLPITEQVSWYAMDHAERMIRNREAIPEDIEEDSSAGEVTRERYGRAMVELNTPQYACAGLNFGYFYDRSPIVIPDGAAPEYSMDRFVESWAPGCRAPHRRLADGSWLLDALGDGYTVAGSEDALRRAGADAWVEAAAEKRMPVAVAALAASSEHDVSGIVVIRPDGHIAYRGDELPLRLLGRLCGRGEG